MANVRTQPLTAAEMERLECNVRKLRKTIEEMAVKMAEPTAAIIRILDDDAMTASLMDDAVKCAETMMEEAMAAAMLKDMRQDAEWVM